MLLFSDLTRLFLSGVFLVAGTSKLVSGFANSRKALADFGVPKILVLPLSFILPIVELVIACLLLPGKSAWFGAIAAAGLLLIFNAAIAANLATGKHPTCNCFGQLHSKPIGWETFARNAAMAVLACLLVWEGRVRLQVSSWSFFRNLTSTEAALAAMVVLVCAGIAVGGFLALHLFRQNGRLLLRIEALEAKSTLAQPQMPVRQALHGLPIGSRAVPFDLPKVNGGKASLDAFLGEGKPILLISTDPNCGPCNALIPEVVDWQKSLAPELSVVLLSHGRESDNRAKAKEHGLQNVLVEKDHKIAEQYQALGTPTAVLIRADGTIGSPAMGGADGIRQLITTKAWTEPGFAAFMQGLGHPPQPPAPKPKVPVGMEAPAFTLPDLDGTAIHSANFNGTGTVVLFWNPACGYCQKMLPQLKEWESGKIASSPRLMLVSTGSRDANRAMGLESMVLIDEKFAVGQSYGASGTPSAVLINSEGHVASGVAVGAPGVLELLNREILIANEPEKSTGNLKSAQAVAK